MAARQSQMRAMRILPLLLLVLSVTFPLSGYLIPFDGYDWTQVPFP